MTNPATDVFAIPELLELILSYVAYIDPLDGADIDDPRSAAIAVRSRTLSTPLHASRVSKTWQAVVQGSRILQHRLFLGPDSGGGRSWTTIPASTSLGPDLPQPPVLQDTDHGAHTQQSHLNTAADSTTSRIDMSTRPMLNPMLQHRFVSAQFRFYPLPPTQTGFRYHAYMTIDRTGYEQWVRSTDCNLTHGLAAACVKPSWTQMQLAAPPIVEVELELWEWLSMEGIGRSAIAYPEWKHTVRNVHGVTIGELMTEVGGVFVQDEALNAIKVSTVPYDGETLDE